MILVGIWNARRSWYWTTHPCIRVRYASAGPRRKSRRFVERGRRRGCTCSFCPLGILRSKNLYSPQRNIAEILWRKLKTEKCLEGIFLYEWLQPGDYKEKSLLGYRVWEALAAVGHDLKIAFKPFNAECKLN